MGTKRASRKRRPKPVEEATAESGVAPRQQKQHHSSRRTALAKLQNSVGNAAILRMIQRQDVSPQERDAKLEVACSLFDEALKVVPDCVALAHSLQGEAVAAMTPGMQAVIPSAQALLAQLQQAGALFDSAVEIYQAAGASLSDIEDLLKLRAHLSAALFFLQQVMAAPASGLHPQVLAHVQAAFVLSVEVKVADAMASAGGDAKKAGPMTQEQMAEQQAKDTALQALYLGPFGTAVTIGA